ncbi:MAG: BrnT family toxin [Okeania sp. SIO3C4]|nr:BrnT family toxin [Okeania sp. SIO3C4]
MEFEWDENKNKSNKEKHGIDFNDAKEVFKDENKKVTPDLRKDYGENRWKVVGQIYGSIISVIYTIREKTRIISARLASRKERKDYNDNE